VVVRRRCGLLPATKRGMEAQVGATRGRDEGDGGGAAADLEVGGEEKENGWAGPFRGRVWGATGARLCDYVFFYRLSGRS
jgi:hypothetical protein